MAENNEFGFVYYRDRAKELGCEGVYDLSHPSIRHGAPIDPSKPGGDKNCYKVNDLSVWQFILENQK